jgi:hypothetical protein
MGLCVCANTHCSINPSGLSVFAVIDSRVLVPMNTDILRALVFLRLTSNLIVLLCKWISLFLSLMQIANVSCFIEFNRVDTWSSRRCGCLWYLLSSVITRQWSMLLLLAWSDFLSLQATRASDFSRDCFHHLNHIPLEVRLMIGRTVVILISCLHSVPKRVLLSFQCLHVAVFSEIPVWLLYFWV